ncbi:single-stranded DNA-binding protein [Pseudoclavibacter sp. AY1H1]|uniref:single-stranded DNA-binding protein n=1 Tax=Pseudoclavibacter sp. AY1H1 TaxID=2080584 RepID=UPI000CE7680C|nr:single-stranded DNA-binding protein [Pseudoclavibacter sp. AY1H1]PPF38527.1 hypothetical protein C5E05_05845 [Pseudoclavibacter sp. AY1H1]
MPAFETDMAIEGNITTTPELKTKGEQIYTRFLLAKNDRNKVDGAWVNGERTSVPCVAYGQEAEMICRTFQSGDLVVAAGRYVMGTRNGKPSNQLTVKLVGPSPRFTAVHIDRERRTAPETGPVVDATTTWATKTPGSGLE